MNPVARGVLAVVAGMAVAFGLIFVVQKIGIRIYPPPAGTQPLDPESFRAMRGQIPVHSLLFVLLSYAAGSVGGGWVAARMAPPPKLRHAMVVGALLLGMGIVNLTSVPHPVWFWIASNPIFLLGAWSGAEAAGAGSEAAQPAPA